MKCIKKLSGFVIVLSLTSISAMLAASCKKEYTDKYNIIPGDTLKVSKDNNIMSFLVKEFSADTVLRAAIIKDSIIIYWPSYKQLPKTIQPEVTVAYKATIVPASGEKISFVTGVKYIVTAESGQKATYFLKVAFMQPLPYFSAAANASYSQGRTVTTQGDNWLADTAQTKVFFINSGTGVQYPAEVLSVTPLGVKFFIGDEIPVGTNYDLKIVNGIQTVYSSFPNSRSTFKVGLLNVLSIAGDLGFPFNLQPGNSFAVRGGRLNEAADVYIYQTISGAGVKLNIESATSTLLQLSVPAGTPPGLYKYIKALSSTGAGALTAGSITINPN